MEEEHEGLLKIQILKLFNEIHDMEFLERLYHYFLTKVSLDEQERMFYNNSTVCDNSK